MSTQSKKWTLSRTTRREAVEDGGTVLANLRGDEALRQ